MTGDRRPAIRRSAFPPEPTKAARSEIEHHIEELADRLEAEGLGREAALAEARRRFGDPAQYQGRLERTERKRRQKMRRVEAWGLIRGAVVQTARTLRRHPAYAAGVIGTLGLGVGANAAMFGILDRLLFQPPTHVVNHERVGRVVIERTFLGRLNRGTTIAFPDFLDLKAHPGLSEVAPFTGARESTLGRGADAIRVRTILAGYELFPLLGVRPEMGRFYGEEDDREDAPLTAVVSHEYWHRAFAGAPDVIGRTLDLAGKTHTVIGVAPEGFTGVDLAPVDVWLPIRATNSGYPGLGSRNYMWMRAVARLEKDAVPSTVEEQATALHRAGREENIDAGNYDPGVRVAFDPLIQSRGPEATQESKVAQWLGGVSLIVLLIACANVANLLLARGTRRRREVSVRLALGAERARMTLFLVGESVMLALLGGALALAFATWGGAALRRVLLPGVAFPGPAVSGRLLLFTAVVAIVAGAAAALGPALQSTRSDLARDLTGSVGTSSRRSRVRALLTAGQAALAAVLLAGAGLFVKSVSEVRRLDLGMDVDQLALVTLEGTTSETPLTDMYVRAMERLREVPGVLAVAGTNAPFQWAIATYVRVPGWDSLPELPGGGPYYQNVTDGYFEAVGLEVVEGRALRPSDGPADPRVTVVSETMSKTLWPQGNALGQCIYVGGNPRRGSASGEADPPVPCTTVVGVVEDASRGSLQEDPHMAYYLPVAQTGDEGINGVYIRTSGDARGVAGAAAAPLRSLDPSLRFASVLPLREILDPQARSWTLGAAMFTIFGLLALVVAAIGLYSVLAFDVAQSTREIGIRTALGAERKRLIGSVVFRGLRMAVSGVVVGLAITVVAAPYVQDLLFQVSPHDPVVFGGAAAFLLLIAFAASLLPGLRATRVDAMEALRTE